MPAGENEEKILFYDTKLCVSFEIWAAKELAGFASSSSQEDDSKIITERPTVESLCDKVPEVGLELSNLAQSLLDSVSGC